MDNKSDDGNQSDDAELNAKSDARKFRDYAAECRRLAQRATEKDRKVLMEIAAAWTVCAEEAERKEGVVRATDRA